MEDAMVDIIHRVGIKAPVSNVYAALATVEGIAGWWTRQTAGGSKPGDTIEVRFLAPGGKEIGSMTLEVAELDPNKKVQWRFTAGPAEWVGTGLHDRALRAQELA
jgi:uncharacterized protein YndB with AHSA1/START domain